MSSIQVRDQRAVWRVGDVVEVRSLDEIMATLDEDLEFDGLPFMPEMVPYCGRQFTVQKVAHKVCDTVSGNGGMLRMDDAVHLADVRCDGSAHGGCQAACLMYWKTAWLRRTQGDHNASTNASESATDIPEALQAATRRPSPDDSPRYRCQATEMLRAAPQPLPIRDVGQYVQDLRTGNASIGQIARALVVGIYNRLEGRVRKALPARLQRIVPGRWGVVNGQPGTTTPSVSTDLQPGERVRIRSRKEIAMTLNERRFNRGLGFDPEMARFCDRTARVARRVEHIIDEPSGRMLTMKQPCIVLEGIVCEGAYSANCPRMITSYWREIWLERLDELPSDHVHASSA